MTLDPNWFYSSLAQSAAGVVGLLGGIVSTRLQLQLERAAEQHLKAAKVMDELRATLVALRTPMQAYHIAAPDQITLLKAKLPSKVDSIERPIWVAPFESNQPARVEVSQRMVDIEVLRQKDVALLLPLLPNPEAITSVHELKHNARELGQALAGLSPHTIQPMSNLSRVFEDAVSQMNILLLRTRWGAFGFLWLCLTGLSIGGLIVPLAFLSAYSMSHQVILLGVFALFMISLLGYIFYQLRLLRSLGRIPPSSPGDDVRALVA